MNDDYLKKLRNELFEIRVSIKLEIDPLRKEKLIEEERKIFKEYKTLYSASVREKYKRGDYNDKYKGK